MTTNNRETLARQWAKKTTPKGDRETLAAIEHILATTTRPTMADAEWDQEKHYLAGADYDHGDPCVMIRSKFGGDIWAIDPSLQAMFFFPAHELTPNGKRYELVELSLIHI